MLPPPPSVVKNNHNELGQRSWFVFVILYFIIDYIRPQDILPIGFLRPGLITTLILTGYVLKNWDFVAQKLNVNQVKFTCAFILLLSAYIPFAHNNHLAYATTKQMLLYLPLILSLPVCINSIERLRSMMLCLACIMIYVSFFSLIHAGMGSGNYFSDENDLSLYINTWLPFCYYLLLTEKGLVRRLIFLSAIIVGLCANIASFSRGGFIGLLCVGLIIWLFSPRKMLALFLICVFGFIFYAFTDQGYWKEMSTTTQTDEGTARERIESWKSAWYMFLDNPLGVGGNNFQVRFPEYQTSYFKRGMWGRVAHSLWFTLLPELGIIGVLIYVLLLGSNIRDLLFLRSLKTYSNFYTGYLNSWSLACIASFGGYFASGTFLSVLYYPHYWYLTGLIVAVKRLSAELNG